MVPSFDGVGLVEGATFFVEDGSGALGPDEGLGCAVVVVEIVMDCVVELGDAQHQRAIRGVHVEADHICDFIFEIRIVRDLERFDQMRLQTGLLPRCVLPPKG